MAKSAGLGPQNDKIVSTVPTDTYVPAFNSYSFQYRPITATYWNALFPYQLLILKVNDDGTYSQTPYRFTLPISPQELSISMPVADEVEATLTGINEKVGGARFRYISIQSTMGVTPTRKNVLAASNNPTAATNAISGGFVNGLTNLGVLPRKPNEANARELQQDNILENTGFWNFHKLKEFIEGYMAIRQGAARSGGKDKEFKDVPTLDPKRVRLAFTVWKDESVYLVKIDRFDSRQSAQQPNEKMWTLNLTAFSRVDINAQGNELNADHFSIPSANALAKTLNAIQSAREIIQLAQRTLTLGVLGPISVISEVARQVSGAIKDLGGIAKTIFDMPENFLRGVTAACLDVANSSVGSASTAVKSFQKLSSLDPKRIFNELKVTLPPELYGTSRTTATPSITSGTSTSNSSAGLQSTPYRPKYSDFHDSQQEGAPRFTGADDNVADAMTDPTIRDVSLDELRSVMTNELRQQIKAEFETNMRLNVEQFQIFRDSILQNLNAFEEQTGTWNMTYIKTYGLPVPTTAQRAPTAVEADFIYATTQLLQSLDEFIVYMNQRQGTLEQVPSSIEYVAGLAARSGIPFRIPRSKFAISFPYGMTLERIASIYLGNPDRWNEIATLNNLRAPYIDEVGFTLKLTTNGDKNTVTVTDASNLFPNQTVSLVSSTVRREHRHIQGIRQAGSVYVVQLDGTPNLERFKVLENATLEAFLPGTVNSQQAIYIPSQDAASVPDDLDSLAGVDQFDPLLRVAGVDFLMTEKNQLIITPYGDTRWAYGLQNLVQYLRIALNTPKNALLQHPGWGLQQKAGQSTADVAAADLFKDIETFVSADPAYTGLLNGNLTINGNNSAIGIEVGIKGLDRPVPIRLGLAR